MYFSSERRHYVTFYPHLAMYSKNYIPNVRIKSGKAQRLRKKYKNFFRSANKKAVFLIHCSSSQFKWQRSKTGEPGEAVSGICQYSLLPKIETMTLTFKFILLMGNEWILLHLNLYILFRTEVNIWNVSARYIVSQVA